MKFNKKTYLYSEDKELKIITKKPFTKKEIKAFEEVCNINETKEDERVIYDISKILDYNKFLYLVAYQLNKEITQSYFKQKLKESFKNYKEIFDNHQKFSFENNYMEFLLKPKLYMYFKFNSTLNFATFIMFNCEKVYEEFDLIVEAEIEAEGCLYDEAKEEEESEELDVEFITKRYNSLFRYISGKYLKDRIYDIHLFQKGKSIKITDEKGFILNTGRTGIDFADVKDFYIKSCNEEADDLEVVGFYLAIIVALSDAERIIVYNSIAEGFKDLLYKDLSVLKQVITNNTEVYISKEDVPRL